MPTRVPGFALLIGWLAYFSRLPMLRSPAGRSLAGRTSRTPAWRGLGRLRGWGALSCAAGWGRLWGPIRMVGLLEACDATIRHLSAMGHGTRTDLGGSGATVPRRAQREVPRVPGAPGREAVPPPAPASPWPRLRLPGCRKGTGTQRKRSQDTGLAGRGTAGTSTGLSQWHRATRLQCLSPARPGAQWRMSAATTGRSGTAGAMCRAWGEERAVRPAAYAAWPFRAAIIMPASCHGDEERCRGVGWEEPGTKVRQDYPEYEGVFAFYVLRFSSQIYSGIRAHHR